MADQLIANDPLVSFLRAAYRVPDRYGKTPAAGKFSVRVPQGGVVKVTLTDGGPRFEAGMSASVMKSLGIHDPSDQGALGRLVADALDFDAATLEPLRLAQAAQEFAAKPTPPLAWSRFMAKLGLSCGREAYGDSWLDSRQAAILSSDLLSSEPPRFSHRSYYPPVEPVWPYVPPKHQMWIEAHDGTAVLMVVLFGQVLGAVPVSDEPPPDGAYSAWSLDPQEPSGSGRPRHVSPKRATTCSPFSTPSSPLCTWRMARTALPTSLSPLCEPTRPPTPSRFWRMRERVRTGPKPELLGGTYRLPSSNPLRATFSPAPLRIACR